MSDIVNELRHKAELLDLIDGAAAKRAAAEIESLRTELAEANNALLWLWHTTAPWGLSFKNGKDRPYNLFIEIENYEGKTPAEAIALAAMQEGK